MDIYTRFDHEGFTVTAYYDVDHETRGSYAYDTDEETREAEDNEIEKLESGEWIALHATVSRPCGECGNARISDSLSGIVIENNENAVQEYLKDVLCFDPES